MKFLSKIPIVVLTGIVINIQITQAKVKLKHTATSRPVWEQGGGEETKGQGALLGKQACGLAAWPCGQGPGCSLGATRQWDAPLGTGVGGWEFLWGGWLLLLNPLTTMSDFFKP